MGRRLGNLSYNSIVLQKGQIINPKFLNAKWIRKILFRIQKQKKSDGSSPASWSWLCKFVADRVHNFGISCSICYRTFDRVSRCKCQRLWGRKSRLRGRRAIPETPCYLSGNFENFSFSSASSCESWMIPERVWTTWEQRGWTFAFFLLLCSKYFLKKVLKISNLYQFIILVVNWCYRALKRIYSVKCICSHTIKVLWYVKTRILSIITKRDNRLSLPCVIK